MNATNSSNNKQESTFRGQYSKSVFETLYFAYRPYFFVQLTLIAIGFVGRIFMLANANFIGYWVDSLCKAPATCKPTPSVFHGFTNSDFSHLLIATTFIGFVLTMVYRIGFSRISAQAVSQLYDEVTWRTSRLPMTFFDHTPIGRIVTRFSSDYGNVFRLFGGPLAELFAIIFELVSMVVLVAIASPYYLSVVFFIAIWNAVVYRLNRSRMRVERRALSASRSPSIAHFAESTHGASSIRIFSRSGVFFKRFDKLNSIYLDQRLRTQKVLSLFSLQMSLSTALLLFLTGVLGIYLLSHGLVSVGSIGVAFTFIILSGTSLQMFFEWMAQFEEAMTGIERLDDYLRRDLEPGLKLPSARTFPTPHPYYSKDEEERRDSEKLTPNLSADVRVHEAWFKYAPDLPYVLKGVDFSIRAGEKLGIIGRTGSGKSTLIQVLFRLYPLERGEILIAGRSADVGGGQTSENSVDLAVYRRSMALISQDPALFRGNLRENLDLTGRISDEQMKMALDRVGLGSWFRSRGSNLDTSIEERGRNLSAGERQLLCMARCLLQESPVVILDEATSSVDPHSEEIMVRATREFFKDRTQIIIAHRLSTLEGCDRILWLHNGEIRMLDRPENVIPVFQQTALA